MNILKCPICDELVSFNGFSFHCKDEFWGALPTESNYRGFFTISKTLDSKRRFQASASFDLNKTRFYVKASNLSSSKDIITFHYMMDTYQALKYLNSLTNLLTFVD